MMMASDGELPPDPWSALWIFPPPTQQSGSHKGSSAVSVEVGVNNAVSRRSRRHPEDRLIILLTEFSRFSS